METCFFSYLTWELSGAGLSTGGDLNGPDTSPLAMGEGLGSLALRPPAADQIPEQGQAQGGTCQLPLLGNSTGVLFSKGESRIWSSQQNFESFFELRTSKGTPRLCLSQLLV